MKERWCKCMLVQGMLLTACRMVFIGSLDVSGLGLVSSSLLKEPAIYFTCSLFFKKKLKLLWAFLGFSKGQDGFLSKWAYWA
ncbi:unnamed protein product [Prunus armeniaca]